MSSMLLFNTSFQNRGDALMVEAVRQRLGPDHRWSLACDAVFAGGRAAQLIDAGLVSMLPGITAKQRLFNQGVAWANAAARWIPRGLSRHLPFVSVRDVDIALDLSGYCFGDHWGQSRVERACVTYRRLREAGSKVILMPRTWGPFDSIGGEALNAMFDQVDLGFARDDRSLAAIEAKLTEANRRRLFFAPDYTHSVPPDIDRWPVEAGAAMIIPSSRVVDSGTMAAPEYLALLGAARAQLAGHGLKPRLLIHETSNDLRFEQQAADMGFADHEVLKPECAIAAKSMIAQASAVVTSRLHGLYNALNSEVPVAVIAWSFKYEEALKQYGCGECLVDAANRGESLRQAIERLVSVDERRRLKRKMRDGRLRAKDATEAMWLQVESVIGAAHGATLASSRRK